MHIEYFSTHFSKRSICHSKTQPTPDGTADPTIDSTVDAASKPSSKLWPTPTETGILSLEVNSKKKR